MLFNLIKWNMFTSIFAFGGGSSLLTYLFDIYVTKLNIISNADFLKISVISQILPGPVALSFLAIVGFKVQGILGWFASILSFATFTSVFSLLFYKHAFKIKFLSELTKYLIPVIICSLIVMTLILCKIPFNFSQKNWIQMLKICFLTIMSIIMIFKKVTNIKIIIVNMIFALIFVLI